MIPVNNILNRVQGWNDNQDASSFKKIAGSRATNLFLTAPTEVAAVAQNILLTPVVAASALLKIGAKIVSVISGSEAVKKFEEKLPGFTDLLRTVARIVAYSIGTVLTATLGVVAPTANFKVHCALGLAINKREEAIQAALNELKAEEAKKQAEEEAAKAAAEKAAEEQRAVELEVLNNLAVAYTVANEIEKEVQDEVLTSVAPLFEQAATVVAKETAVVAAAVEQEEEEEVAPKFEIVLDEVRAGVSVLSSAVSTVSNGAKAVASGTVNAITHPVETTKNVYNYVTGFFVAQKA